MNNGVGPVKQHDFSSQLTQQSEVAGPASFLIVVNRISSPLPQEMGIFSGWEWQTLRTKILRAGFVPEECQIKLLKDVQTIPPRTVVVGMGESVLNHFTDKKSVDKWNLSPLVLPNGSILIPTYDMDRLRKQPEVGLYQELAFRRAKDFFMRWPKAHVERFHLNPDLSTKMDILRQIKNAPDIAVDVETGYGQINTVGFAWSPNDAIAINVLPGGYGADSHYQLWQLIRDVLEGPAKKTFQNFIYDVSYFSAYGIRTQNIHHDTMWAMKVLWPELKSNLGNVGRFYTERPYWKDDGKIADEEGKKKDWGNIRDWHKHYLYNCRDTTGTWEARQNQIEDLKKRNLHGFFYDYVMKLHEPILEMCSNGVPLDLQRRSDLLQSVDERITTMTKEFHSVVGRELNPRSPRQVQNYLKEKNIPLPKKYDKQSGGYKESSDSAAIKKIRLKFPQMKELELLQDIKSLEKALSSYIDFGVRKDGNLSYSLNGCGTETLRWSGGKDMWDNGFNIQTIPREGGEVSIKSMFVSPENWSFLEVDLRQAESRFVAYDAADKTLIDMLESGDDVHSHVGRAILQQMNKSVDGMSKEEFKKTWRQLGKKAGHGLNYAMKPGVFVDTVFNELDLVISKKDAEIITKAYYGLFPGIPKWHAWIRSELNVRRKLTAPSGWERYFYGRFGDDMFKEAYAWRPQHTIPWVTNKLMLYLHEQRKISDLGFKFLIQVHDALYLMVPDDQIERTAKICLNHLMWHPEIQLPGGKLYIPTEVQIGKRLSEMKEFH
jgi:DNA polymerase I-like protein with 3'-5' exonuclease and polymerase domains